MLKKRKCNTVVQAGWREDADRGVVVVWEVKDAGVLELPLAQVSPVVMTLAAVHGLIQRVSDRAAIGRNRVSGQPATPQEKFWAMKRVVDHYASGAEEWALRTEEGKQQGGSVLQQALSEVTGRSLTEVRTFLRGRSVEEKQALAGAERVKEVVKRLEGERARAVGIDPEGLLRELMGEEGDR